MTAPPAGRRDRKNARTRQALADTALHLFLERGYDQVSVKEIADAVDISLPTLFRHVPEGKQALIFDDGSERRESLLGAVHQRPEGRSVLAALREFFAGRGPLVADPSPRFRQVTELIVNTPALRDQQRALWIRCEEPLAEAIATELGAPPGDVTARAVAHYVLEIPQLIGTEPEPRAALDAIFDLLEHGLSGARKRR